MQNGLCQGAFNLVNIMKVTSAVGFMKPLAALIACNYCSLFNYKFMSIQHCDFKTTKISRQTPCKIFWKLFAQKSEDHDL